MFYLKFYFFIQRKSEKQCKIVMQRNEHQTTLTSEHLSATPTSVLDQTLHCSTDFCNGNEISAPHHVSPTV